MQRHETDRMRPFAVRTPLVHLADASGTYAPTMPTRTSPVTRSCACVAIGIDERTQVHS